jgi:hypothetical protein
MVARRNRLFKLDPNPLRELRIMGITCGSYPKSATVLPSSTPIMKATVRVKDIANSLLHILAYPPGRTSGLKWTKLKSLADSQSASTPRRIAYTCVETLLSGYTSYS